MVGWIATIISRTRRAAAAIAADRAGGIAVITAVSLAPLIGAAGLGTEAGLWYVAKRDMQGAADAAGFSAATAIMAGQTSSSAISATAKAVTARYGFTNEQAGVVVTVNNPPKSGNYTTNSSAVEVIVQQPQTLLFSALFLASSPTISARAVGVAGVAGNGCVLTLDKGNVTDLTDSGAAVLNLNNCGIDVNSSSVDALSINGGATINAYNASIVGNYETSGGGTLNATHGITTGTATTSDPYASLNVPSYSGCNQNSYSLSGGTQNISAGGGAYVFCNGLSVSGGATLTLGAGVYIIDRGSFSLSGSATINATSGTTIVLTSSTGAGYATAQVSGGTTLNLTAPSSGPTAGLAVFQDRNAPSSGTDSFSGGSSQNITGTLYFPNQGVSYSGGASNGGAVCTQLVAFTAQFTGSSNFNNNCVGVGVASIGGSASKLVE